MNDSISVILLAGGKGTRMQNPIPKQFLSLNNEPIAIHSLKIFLTSILIREIVVVAAPEFRNLFAGYEVKFANPGLRRQDSVYSGLQEVSENASWILVHDAARPFISTEMIQTLFEEGRDVGAATVGMPIKWTVKEIEENNLVGRTLERDRIWEIQTPQLLAKKVIQKGFAHAMAHNLTVTDDVSLAELVGNPVKLVKGHYQNIKITTPEDLVFAQCLKQ